MSIVKMSGGKRMVGLSIVLLGSLLLAAGLAWGLGILYPPGVSAEGATVIRYVLDDGGVDAGDCTDSQAPCRTIQYAVAQALTGDTVQVANKFAPASYTGPVVVDRAIILQGGWVVVPTPNVDLWQRPVPCEASRTIIDGGGVDRAVVVTGSIAPTIDCFTLTGEDATGLGNDLPGLQGTYDTGGGVYSYRADTTIRDCVVRGNTASTTGIGWGGGIGYIQGTVTVRNSVVADNVASTVSNGYGGGIYGRQGAGVILSNTVADNVATEGAGGLGLGGGMQFHFGRVTLQGNHVRRNTASVNGTGYGGGLSLFMTPQVVVSGDDLADNHAAGVGQTGYGGAISARELGGLTLDGVGLVANAATYGGGVYVDNMETSVSHSKLLSNTAEWGGGLYAVGDTGPSLTVTMASNAVLWNVAETPSSGSGGRGGGLAFIFANVDLVGNEIAENRTDGAGGGVQMEQVNATLRDTLIRDNRAVGVGAGSGGGLHLISSSAAMTNTVLIDNRVSCGGAGMAAVGAYARMVHTTVARNTGGDDAGIYLTMMHPGGPAAVLMTDSLVVDHGVGITATAGTMGMTNTATLDGVLWYGNGANTGGGGVMLVSNATTGDPAFLPDGYHLGPGSAAIDQGVGMGGVADIDGDTRPIGPAVDLGADEAPRWLFLPLVMRGA
jgi:fibronectin-binding autotransporter adhesin